MSKTNLWACKMSPNSQQQDWKMKTVSIQICSLLSFSSSKFTVEFSNVPNSSSVKPKEIRQVSAVLPGSRHAASLMAPTGLLLTSSWIHLPIIDTCISKHSVYLRCKMYYLLHTASIARLSVLGEGSLLCCSPWGFSHVPLNCGFFLWKCFLVRCEGLRTEGLRTEGLRTEGLRTEGVIFSYWYSA